MINLMVGANVEIPSDVVTIKILSDKPVDASAFRLFANGKIRDDLDMIFYGQPKNDNGSILWQRNSAGTEFTVDLPRMHPDVQKIAFTITCDEIANISGLRNLSIQVLDRHQEILANGVIDLSNRQEAALIMGEIYRRNQSWKFRFIAQGFNGGLKPLAEHFGVEIADEPAPKTTQSATPIPAPVATPTPAASAVNLSKVSLTKEKSTISLTKKDDYGKIGINLDWHKANTKQSSGLLGGLFGGGNKDVDLDLGAFVRLRNGDVFVIQALGNSFGSLNTPCYVQLMGDDRTGTSRDGEWMYVNGSKWKEIDEVLIYAFIYEGVPSWDQTDGVVRIHVPDQPVIETRLTEGNNRKTLCGIARIVNDNGAIRVERINRYFKHQGELDDAYGWGFNWSSGRK